MASCSKIAAAGDYKIQRITKLIYPVPPVANDEDSENEISQRVINGQEAQEGQFPHAVWITAFRGFVFRARVFRCGGSIISKYWILTAGHCIRHSSSYLDMTSYYIQAGTLVVDTPGVEPRQYDTIYEEDAFAHPEYNDTTLQNDIGLLKSHGFDFSTKYVQPIALAPSTWTDSEVRFLGKTFILSGYGNAVDNLRLPNHLRWTELDFYPMVECAAFYYSDVLPTSVFCAGDVVIPIHSGCSGDSGGALIFEKSPGKFVEVGVVSFGPGQPCSYAPGGFTSVALFRDWIDSTMAENS
ncbi:Peptidase S1, PA clan [Sergentomyia squamirostris]